MGYAIYKNRRQKNREVAGRARNTVLNNVYKKFGLPKNMANKEIGRRVKNHNWVAGKIITEGSHNNGSNSQIINAHKNQINTYTKFLNNDTLLNESKRKSLITLAIQLGDKSVIALRNPVVIKYLMRVQYLVTARWERFRHIERYRFEFSNVSKPFTKQLKALGKYREDAAMVSVLKKRINLLKKIYKLEGYPFLSNNLYNDLHNRGILLRIWSGRFFEVGDHFVLHPNDIKEIMDILLPLPPHTNSTRKTAAARIQKTVRRRKKVATRKTAGGEQGR